MKRLLSILLCAVMLVVTVPTMVFAADTTVEVSNGMAFRSDTTQDAIDQWAAGAATIQENSDGSFTVTLQKNITLKQGATSPITFGNFQDGKTQPAMILDLNGCTVSAKTIVIANYGNLVIRDSQGTGKIVYDGGQYMTAVQNSGYSLTVQGGTFECVGADSVTYNAAIHAAAGTETMIDGGTFDGNGAGALITYGNVTINGGTFNGAYGVVSKKAGSGETGSITFPENSTAVIHADKMAFVVHGDGTNNGTIDVKGGSFDAPSIAGKLSSADPKTDITIAGGSYTADPSDYVAGETASIKHASGQKTLYAVGGDAQALANTAKPGDTITVLSGNTITVPDQVTVENQTGNDISVNGETIEKDSAATVHKFDRTSWKSDKDSHWHECECGEKTDIAAHTWGDWTVTQQATETEKGEKKRTCSACGYEETVEIPVLPHTHKFGTEWKTDKDNHWHECVCGEKGDIAAHAWGDWTVTQQATETEKGEKKHTCSVCGYEETAEIPVLTHTHKFDTAWKSDSENHWNECACGEKGNLAAHTMKWVVDREPTAAQTGSKHEECTVCGYQKAAVEIPVIGTTTPEEKPDPEKPADVPQTGDGSNMLVWIAAMMMAGTVLTGTALCARKGKHSR